MFYYLNTTTLMNVQANKIFPVAPIVTNYIFQNEYYKNITKTFYSHCNITISYSNNALQSCDDTVMYKALRMLS